MIGDFRQSMGCLAPIFLEAFFLGHIKPGQKYQVNRALAPLYVTNALCILHSAGDLCFLSTDDDDDILNDN